MTAGACYLGAWYDVLAGALIVALAFVAVGGAGYALGTSQWRQAYQRQARRNRMRVMRRLNGV